MKKYLLFLALLLSPVATWAQTVTVGAPQVVMTPSQRNSAGLSVWPDGNIGGFFQTPNYYLFAPNGAADNTQGLTTPNINALQSNLVLINTTTNLQKGAAGAFDQNYAACGAVYKDSATGILLCSYHGEFWYAPPNNDPFYAGLGIAYSSDNGVTWHKLGQVISPQTTRTGNCQVDTGVGTLVVKIIGGIQYFWDYYLDEASGCNGGNFNITIAQAKVSDVIAAAQAGIPLTSGPGTLFKKLCSGAFTCNGVNDLANPAAGGGAFDNLPGLTTNTYYTPAVAYNSFLNQYVLTYSNSFASIEMRISTDGVGKVFGPPTTVVSGGGVPPNGLFYPSPLNTNGGDPTILGNQFQIYWVDNFGNWSASNLVRSMITVGPSTALGDAFYSQSGSGMGTSCADTLPYTFFNTSANWGTGGNQIGPGTRNHICGSLSNTLNFQGDGVAGSPISLLWETGAKLSQGAGDLVHLNGHNYLTLDGQINGIIENTANGTLLANHLQVHAIEGSNSSNIEVKNLNCRNIYVAAPPTNIMGFDETLSNCYYANGFGNVSIHDTTMSDVGWAINMPNPFTGALLNIQRVSFFNENHGVSASGPNQFTLVIDSSSFGATKNWDTTANAYHHDGIHLNTSFNSSTTNQVSNNLFYGDQGVNNTAHIFYENSPPNVLDFNNIHIQFPGNYLNDGFVTGGGANFQMYNDSYVGDPTVNNDSCMRLLTSSNPVIENNLFSGCNNLFSVEAGTTGQTIDYNIYAQQGTGGNSRWNWEANGPTNDFNTWKTNCGGCDSHSTYQNNANVSATTAVPNAGSSVLGAGKDLSGLGISALDCDTTAGGSRSCTPRTVPWSVGGYQGSSVTPPAPAPPAGLNVMSIN